MPKFRHILFEQIYPSLEQSKVYFQEKGKSTSLPKIDKYRSIYKMSNMFIIEGLGKKKQFCLSSVNSNVIFVVVEEYSHVEKMFTIPRYLQYYKPLQSYLLYDI